MEQDRRLYHYTTLESLALILKHRTIRFTRLDRLDDVTEAQRMAGIDFGKYTLVSCWTEEAEDSLPQWHMYASGMRGVRIEMPANPFFQHEYSVPSGQSGIEVNSIYLSPIRFEEGLVGNCFVTPLMFENGFAGPVVYPEDVQAEIAKHAQESLASDGSPSFHINKPGDLVRYKAKIWEFQKEYRFVLAAMPTGGDASKGLGKIVSATREGIDHGLYHFDVPIRPGSLDDLVVRTGPLCTPGSFACVEALLEKWAPSARLETSPLAGTVR